MQKKTKQKITSYCVHTINLSQKNYYYNVMSHSHVWLFGEFRYLHCNNANYGSLHWLPVGF